MSDPAITDEKYTNVTAPITAVTNRDRSWLAPLDWDITYNSDTPTHSGIRP